MASRVTIILGKLPEQIEAIRGQYARSLADREISDDLLHDIARFVEDCQRALDWTATDLDRKYGQARDRSPYYPLADTQGRFEATMTKDFSGIPRPVYEAMERHQPYQQEKHDLRYLRDLTRVNKHQDFTPQTRTEMRRVRVSGSGGSVEWSPGTVTFGNGVSILGVSIDHTTQIPIPSPIQEVREVIYVGWNFADPNAPVLPTLESLCKLIAEALADVRRAAGL